MPNLLNLSLRKSEPVLFFSEKHADTPASKNIAGMNHGDINTTIEAIFSIFNSFCDQFHPRHLKSCFCSDML